MKYFVFNHQRDGSCYHEFYKGKWDSNTHWKDNSIFLNDDVLCKDFVDAIMEIIPSYDPYNATKITISQWKKIGEIIVNKDLKSQEIYNEADAWLNTVFTTYDCFTILGI